MDEITAAELLGQFEPSVHQAIFDAVKKYQSTHVVIFKNLNFDSLRFGAKVALAVGPNNTYKSPGDCKGKWLNNLPSERLYPVSYARVPDDWLRESDA